MPSSVLFIHLTLLSYLACFICFVIAAGEKPGIEVQTFKANEAKLVEESCFNLCILGFEAKPNLLFAQMPTQDAQSESKNTNKLEAKVEKRRSK